MRSTQQHFLERTCSNPHDCTQLKSSQMPLIQIVHPVQTSTAGVPARPHCAQGPLKATLCAHIRTCFPCQKLRSWSKGSSSKGSTSTAMLSKGSSLSAVKLVFGNHGIVVKRLWSNEVPNNFILPTGTIFELSSCNNHSFFTNHCLRCSGQLLFLCLFLSCLCPCLWPSLEDRSGWGRAGAFSLNNLVALSPCGACIHGLVNMECRLSCILLIGTTCILLVGTRVRGSYVFSCLVCALIILSRFNFLLCWWLMNAKIMHSTKIMGKPHGRPGSKSDVKWWVFNYCCCCFLFDCWVLYISVFVDDFWIVERLVYLVFFLYVFECLIVWRVELF